MRNCEATSFGANLTRELRESRSSEEKLLMDETGHNRKDNTGSPEGLARKENSVKEQEVAFQSEQLSGAGETGAGGGAGGVRGGGGGGGSEQPAAGERPTLQLEAIHLVSFCVGRFFTRSFFIRVFIFYILIFDLFSSVY